MLKFWQSAGNFVRNLLNIVLLIFIGLIFIMIGLFSFGIVLAAAIIGFIMFWWRARKHRGAFAGAKNANTAKESPDNKFSNMKNVSNTDDSKPQSD